MGFVEAVATLEVGNMTGPRMVVTRARVPVKIWTDEVDSASIDQLLRTASMPFVHHHVAAMPDVHLGLGATVGSVVPTKGAIIPAAVGVDIGCGMCAVRTELSAGDLPESLRTMRSAIERRVPVGFGRHERAPAGSDRWWNSFRSLMRKHGHADRFDDSKRASTVREQLGTLGGGNHFIEVCLDEKDRVWVMLHSGSRGIGNQVGRYFIELAKEDMRVHRVNLPDRDLAYLSEGTQHFDAYWDALQWCQQYARCNRDVMLASVLDALRDVDLEPGQVQERAVNCHHNYVEREHHFGDDVLVTRKGAIRAGEGELGIIPGSMGSRSYIVRGKGNPDSFQSCAHGAGRRMSRSAAKRRYTARDVVRQTEGVECRKDRGVVDEVPAAYKDIDRVMHHQRDLVEVVHTLKQVVCVKG